MEPWLETFARANFERSADTAHDLKTPLNIAVLNLELLRMRVAKLTGASADEKILAYAAAIEAELRRMAEIFDAFFLLSSPPRGEDAPVAIDIAPAIRDAATAAGLDIKLSGAAMVKTHESRIRQALTMFFGGATKVLQAKGRAVAAERRGGRFDVLVSGIPESAEFEMTKIFKFYYTDPLGNPDISLAASRLIAETYGGELNVTQERDKVTLRLSLPLGDQ